MSDNHARLDRVRKTAAELSRLLHHVHPLLRPHLQGVIDFASKWEPELRINPREIYDTTQYPMEEAALLDSAAQAALAFNRAACIGGMAVFFEAFRQAKLDRLIERSPSGIADLSDAIWGEFDEALAVAEAETSMRPSALPPLRNGVVDWSDWRQSNVENILTTYERGHKK